MPHITIQAYTRELFQRKMSITFTYLSELVVHSPDFANPSN
jgi:hypothetical protein